MSHRRIGHGADTTQYLDRSPVVNGFPSLEKPNGGMSDGVQSPSRPLDIAEAAAHATVPAWLQLSVMVGLIFGGCCSNVSALAGDRSCSPLITSD